MVSGIIPASQFHPTLFPCGLSFTLFKSHLIQAISQRNRLPPNPNLIPLYGISLAIWIQADRGKELGHKNSHSVKSGIIAFLAACLLITGCATQENLDPDPAFPGEDNTLIRSPIGRFSVHGTASNPDEKAPDLCSYFFHDFLRGFDVDNIEILPTEDSNRVLIQPYVGTEPIIETLVLEARPQNDGTVRWGMETPTGQSLVTQILGPPISILATWGTTVFLFGNETTELLTDDEGALFIYYKSVAVAVGLMSPRVVNSHKLWYRYPAFPPEDPEAAMTRPAASGEAEQ